MKSLCDPALLNSVPKAMHYVILRLPVLLGCFFISYLCGSEIKIIKTVKMCVGVFAFGVCLCFPQVFCSSIWFTVSLILNCLENNRHRGKSVYYCLTFGAIVSAFLDSCYLLCYKFVCIVDVCFRNLLHINLDRNVTTALVSLVFATILALSCKFNVIQHADVKLLSTTVFGTYFSLFGFFLIVLLKSFTRRMKVNRDFYEFMWSALLLAILVCFVFYVAMQRLSRLRAIDRNYAFDVAVSNTIRSSECCFELSSNNFEYEYEHDKVLFAKKLGRFGIDYSVPGYSHLLLCLIILKRSSPDTFDFDKAVYDGFASFECLSTKPIFAILNDMVKEIRKIEILHENEFDCIDTSITGGVDLVRFFLQVA